MVVATKHEGHQLSIHTVRSEFNTETSIEQWHSLLSRHGLKHFPFQPFQLLLLQRWITERSLHYCAAPHTENRETGAKGTVPMLQLRWGTPGDRITPVSSFTPPPNNKCILYSWLNAVWKVAGLCQRLLDYRQCLCDLTNMRSTLRPLQE